MDCPRCGSFCSVLDEHCNCGYELPKRDAAASGLAEQTATPKKKKKKRKNQPMPMEVIGESARTMRANKAIAGKPCAACDKQISLGDELAVCKACDAPHHLRCYADNGGCVMGGCVNAPLQRLRAERSPVEVGAAGIRMCPSCHSMVSESESQCPHCRAGLGPGVAVQGAKINAPGAVASIVYGVVGLVICGPLFGYMAIRDSGKAKRLIAGNPSYEGEGLATAGYFLGIADIVLFFVYSFIRLSNAGNSSPY
jgi:Prokaryotic RING finger family 1